eukprot:TRINITY_DN35214_c0_g1_i1.p1 TRINITY_DN35214_c0_g1~~TRINITY_DN35214_c0_g1_i1.p1  ORF type:complete len:281 (-),score=34.43 TRINITY_DN35214_c0_g1_i1:332-1174(-)
MDLLVEGVAGGLGGCIGRACAFPFDTLKVKLATRSSERSARIVIRDLLVEEGVFGLYRGVVFSASEAFLQKLLYAIVFAAFKKAYLRILGRSPNAVATVACGYLSDLFSVPFCVPIEAMVVQLQSASANVSRCAIVNKALFTYDGLSDSLKSGKAYLVLSLKAGLEFAIFDTVKKNILENSDGKVDLAPFTAFSVGGVARAIATAIMYPGSRGKAMTQAKLAPDMLSAVLHVRQTAGILALYQGLGMELMRGVTQASVMFAVMERLRAIVRDVLLRKQPK